MNNENKKLGEIFQPIFLNVEESIARKIEEGTRKEEDHITSALFDLLEERVNATNHLKLKITANQFPGRGPRSIESITGADGALILDVNLDNIRFRKVVLLQAKNRDVFDKKSIDQKYKMLFLTPDSFFVVYHDKKISFVSAFIVGAGDKLNQLPSKRIDEFLGDYFNCFIGDHFLTLPPHPFRHHLMYWFSTEKFKDDFKSEMEMPMAQNNLLIKVESRLGESTKSSQNS